MKKGFSKRTLVTFCAIAIFIGVGLAYAVPQWAGTISWNYQAVDKSISVTGEQTIDLGNVIGPQTVARTYVVQNTGNVEATVTATATATGATATWNQNSAVIAPGASATFELTLDITGAGSCSVSFNVA